jgi:hypothetical protein
MPPQSSLGRPRKQERSRHCVYVPKTLNASQVLRGLPPQFQAQTQSVWYLVDLVHRKMSDSETKPAALHYRNLRNILGQKNARTILEACLENGILVTDGEYSRKEKCRRFWLGTQFKNADFVHRELTDTFLLERLAKVHQKDRENWEPCHHRLESWQESLGIDKPMADEILRNTPAKKDRYRNQTRLIDDIDQQIYRMTVDDRGRVYGNATNVRKDIRPALLLNGNRIAGLDIRNSQPLFLGLLMTQRCIPGTEDYVDLVCHGGLYHHLSLLAGITRSEAKKRFLVDVLGKSGNYPSELEDVFESEFPEPWQFVQDFNRDDHCALLLELQRVEADLVIRNICMSLPMTHPFFTIHDAIYFQDGDQQMVENAFAQNPYGFRIPLAVA